MTASADEQGDQRRSLCITDLPNEILEQILCHLSPYRDFKSAMLVCHQWHRVMQGVMQVSFSNFHRCITNTPLLEWHALKNEVTPTISERYSHSACYHDKSMYVFGGCTSSQTTFNDLWRLDLDTRRWERPIAIGTYPSPKACASLVSHNDRLILFGGWSHPTPYPLHQAARFFNQLHVFVPATGRWSHVQTPPPAPPGKAGHAAAVVRDVMLVFGGSHGHGVSCNELWVLDLRELTWHKRDDIVGSKPLPRYGHSQITLDSGHMLVIGGCGGPNMQFTDVWMLNLDTEPWSWTEIKVLQPEHSPPQLWCHPACKVGDKAVVLSKTTRPPKPPPPPPAWTSKKPYPPRSSSLDRPGPSSAQAATGGEAAATGGAQGTAADEEDLEGVVGRVSIKGQYKRSRPETSESSSQESSSDQDDIPSTSRRHSYRQFKLPNSPPRGNYRGYAWSGGKSGPGQSSRSRQGHGGEDSEDGASGGGGGSGGREPSPVSEYQHHRARTRSRSDEVTSRLNKLSSDDDLAENPPGTSKGQDTAVDANTTERTSPRSGAPSIRPNAMKNRQKQLETLKKYEEKLRNKMAKPSHKPDKKDTSSQLRRVQNPMFIHTLDVSRAVSDFTVTWQPIAEHPGFGAPEETIFYSLIEGRGELVMFGGIQTDLNGMQRGLNVNLQFVSNEAHFIEGPKYMITRQMQLSI